MLLTTRFLAEAVVKQLFELEEWKTSKKISVYISMPNGEIDTRAIIEQLLLHSKGAWRWKDKDAMENRSS